MRWRRRSRARDHPRVRGDGAASSRIFTPRQGSPPRARGRPRLARRVVLRRGITPACAGTARAPSWKAARRRDHPRVRGDGSTSMKFQVWHWGSPPRARGRRLSCVRGKRGCGITPACAGTACSALTSATPFRDHPRVRGDGAKNDDMITVAMGSPPRARGRLALPTAARSALRDHPRVRGDGTERSNVGRSRRGSPPRARGRRVGGLGDGGGSGITPACAGTAFSPRPRPGSRRDHPRVRGDGKTGPGTDTVDGGSPPRARGRRPCRRRHARP